MTLFESQGEIQGESLACYSLQCSNEFTAMQATHKWAEPKIIEGEYSQRVDIRASWTQISLSA